MAVVKINLAQVGQITSEASIRNHKFLIDRPEIKGGTDKGPMGGELLLAGLGGCFMSNLLAAIQARDVDASGINIEVCAILEDGPPRFSSITIEIHGNYSDSAEMEKLALMAERGCIVANSIKGSIKLDIKVT
jgi:putative redox protein